jgi:hypothetical protein
MTGIWLVLFILCTAICVLGAVLGAVKTTNGFLGVAANLSIPIWFASVIGALAMPQYPGWDPREIAMLAVVVILGIAMAVLNQKDNNKMLERLK